MTTPSSRPRRTDACSPARALTVLTLASLLAGCGTTRMTDTQRTATEQLLITDAIDQAVSQLDFRVLAGKPVFFDPQYLDGTVDRGYLVSSMRQHLLASGCILQEDRAKATYVLEARSGCVGTDRHGVLFGVPAMNVPSFVPGQPTQIPEIPFARKTDQNGFAKILVFAYNRQSGLPVWQSGAVLTLSTAQDTWLFGAGPFQRGTIRQGMEFAGQKLPPLPLPSIGSGDDESLAARPPVVGVAQAAVWSEPTPAAAKGSPWTSDTRGRALRGKSLTLTSLIRAHLQAAEAASNNVTPPPPLPPPVAPNSGGASETLPRASSSSGLSGGS